MKATNSRSGYVLKKLEDAYGIYHFSRSKTGKERLISYSPHLQENCPLDFPAVVWKKGRINPPSGTLISAIFGEEGWRKGELRPEIETVVGHASETFVETYRIRSFTRRLCWRLACRDCVYLRRCQVWRPLLSGGNNEAATDGTGEPLDEMRRHTRVFENPPENAKLAALCKPDPIERRIHPYFHSWMKMRDYHMKRAILILAVLGQDSMRPGGYIRNDIARIAGVSPGNQNAVNRLEKNLRELGFVRRRRRKPGFARFKYRYGGNRKKMQESGNEALKDIVRTTVVDLLVKETHSRLEPGMNFSEAGLGMLFGEQPPVPIIELIADVIDIAFVNVFENLLGPRLYSRACGESWSSDNTDQEDLEILAHRIQRLQEFCDSMSEEHAAQWWEMYKRMYSGEMNRGPILVIDIPEMFHLISR